MRYTVAVPKQHQEKANELAMALGLSANDKNTYSDLKYVDCDGNLYSVASFIASSATASKADAPLERPVWDVENEDVDMQLAETAKGLLTFGVKASVDKISVKTDIEGLDAIQFMGLVKYNPETEDLTPLEDAIGD